MNWLVVAGLAKGDHQDRDDVYQRIQRDNDGGNSTTWLPTDDDVRLLKQETAARMLTVWELGVQQQLLDALRGIHDGGTARLDISHPIRGQKPLAVLEISVAPVREDDYEADEIMLEVCGAHFVPTQDHDSLPCCPICHVRLEELTRVAESEPGPP